MRGRIVSIAFVLGIAGAANAGLSGSVEVIGPFTGDASETFEFFFPGTSGDLDILGGTTVMSGGFVISFSSFQGSTIIPHSGGLFAHWTAPVDFFFDSAVSAFGGYIATNSGTSGGLVEFFGPNDLLFASAPLDVIFQQGTAPYTWNGWIADFPITHIRVSSAGILEGFLGYDDLQVTFFVPSPGGLLLFLVPLARGPRRRDR